MLFFTCAPVVLSKTCAIVGFVQMAEQYPVALFYDFMVTCKSSLSKFKVDLHRLEVLLANSIMEKFVISLKLYVNVPIVVIVD